MWGGTGVSRAGGYSLSSKELRLLFDEDDDNINKNNNKHNNKDNKNYNNEGNTFWRGYFFLLLFSYVLLLLSTHLQR